MGGVLRSVARIRSHRRNATLEKARNTPGAMAAIGSATQASPVPGMDWGQLPPELQQLAGAVVALGGRGKFGEHQLDRMHHTGMGRSHSMIQQMKLGGTPPRRPLQDFGRATIPQLGGFMMGFGFAPGVMHQAGMTAAQIALASVGIAVGSGVVVAATRYARHEQGQDWRTSGPGGAIFTGIGQGAWTASAVHGARAVRDWWKSWSKYAPHLAGSAESTIQQGIDAASRIGGAIGAIGQPGARTIGQYVGMPARGEIPGSGPEWDSVRRIVDWLHRHF